MNISLSDLRRSLVFLLLGVAGCTAIPDGLRPVGNFDSQRYLGAWYEIARLDNRFERGLEDVSATYSARADGGIEVRNRGYDPSAEEWREAVGRAYPVGDPSDASLEVSFFWPFYGGYHVIALGKDYDDALVAGADRSYLWILARERTLSKQRRDELVSIARDAGFETGALLWVPQTRDDPELE